MIYEAKCLSCEATFNPVPTSDRTAENPTGLTLGDMEHLVRDDGAECGGYGLLQGSWEQPIKPLTNPVTDDAWTRDELEVGAREYRPKRDPARQVWLERLHEVEPDDLPLPGDEDALAPWHPEAPGRDMIDIGDYHD